MNKILPLLPKVCQDFRYRLFQKCSISFFTKSHHTTIKKKKANFHLLNMSFAHSLLSFLVTLKTTTTKVQIMNIKCNDYMKCNHQSIKMIKAIVKQFYETFKLYASFQVFSVKNKETTYCVMCISYTSLHVAIKNVDLWENHLF